MNRLTATILVSFALILGVLVGQGRFPPPASAYPAGAAVSYGANPIVATGGSVTAGSSATLFTAPAGQDIVVTDLVLTGGFSSSANFTYCRGATVVVTLSTASGTRASAALGYVTTMDSQNGNAGLAVVPVTMSLSSGLPVAAGETLTVTTSVLASYSTTYCDPNLTVAYTATGYYAEP